MIRWEQQDAIPWGVAAVLGSLQGHAASFALSDADWKEALAFTDRFQLTLLLECDLPAWARDRISRDRDRNGQRNRRLLEVFAEVDRVTAGIPIAVLKGFANWALFPVARENRVQYDLDLYCPQNAQEVRNALLREGYEAIESPLTLVRRSNWKWNGDFYDPEIPIAIDLHERLWDEGMEHFSVPGLEQFWQRKVWRKVEEIRFAALAPPDSLAFSVLHMLRHLLHGDARPMQVYEIAALLETRRADDAFWAGWRALHPPELRRLQAIGFRLAEEWFGSSMHGAVREEVAALPAKIGRWFERFAASPLTAFFRPNKDELALNLSLLDGFGAKASIVRRRVLPARLPRPFSYALARAMFHLRAASTMFRILR